MIIIVGFLFYLKIKTKKSANILTDKIKQVQWKNDAY